MKRIVYILGIAALGLTACQSEEKAFISPMEPASTVEVKTDNVITSFQAVFADDAITRTQLGDDYYVSWTKGDKIMVIPSNVDFTDVYDYSKAAEFSATDDGREVKFEGSIIEEDYYCAVYPSSAYLDIVNYDHNHTQAIRMNIPSSQTATPNSFAENLNIAYAHSETIDGETKLVFNNVCALIKFKLSGSNASKIQEVRIIPNDGNTRKAPTLNGNIYIEGKSGKVLDVKSEHDDLLVVLKGDNFDDSSSFYVVVPPVTLANGFTMTFFDNQHRYYVKYATKEVTLKSNTILDLGTINVDEAKFHDIVKRYNLPSVNSCREKAVPFVVIPEGFTNEELSDYEEKAKEMFNFIFEVEPYKTYKEYFNLYIMKIESEESGVDDFKDNIYRRTFFNAGYWSDGGDHDDMTANFPVVMNFVIDHCPDIQEGRVTIYQTPIIMLMNDSRYGGICHLYGNGAGFAQVTTFANAHWYGNNHSTNAPTAVGDWLNCALHEGGGHCFGLLADEYWHDDATCTDQVIGAHNESVPLYLNLTLNYDNPPWSFMIPSKEGAVEAGKFPYVGRYEGGTVGGKSYGKGIWRSEQVTCMDDNRPYFGTWQRYLIVKRIFDIVGEEFTYEKFLENDRQYQDIQNGVENAGMEGRITTTYNGLTPTFNSANTRSNYVEKYIEPTPMLAPPVIHDSSEWGFIKNK